MHITIDNTLNGGENTRSGENTHTYPIFSDQVVDRWNKLDQDIIKCESVNGFKTRLENGEIWRWASSWIGLSPSTSSLKASLDLEFSDPVAAVPGAS